MDINSFSNAEQLHAAWELSLGLKAAQILAKPGTATATVGMAAHEQYIMLSSIS